MIYLVVFWVSDYIQYGDGSYDGDEHVTLKAMDERFVDQYLDDMVEKGFRILLLDTYESLEEAKVNYNQIRKLHYGIKGHDYLDAVPVTFSISHWNKDLVLVAELYGDRFFSFVRFNEYDKDINSFIERRLMEITSDEIILKWDGVENEDIEIKNPFSVLIP